MTKALVTGGSGFIGSHLVKALAARGDEVACLVRKTSAVAELKALGVRLIQGDIADHPVTSGGHCRARGGVPGGRVSAGEPVRGIVPRKRRGGPQRGPDMRRTSPRHRCWWPSPRWRPPGRRSMAGHGERATRRPQVSNYGRSKHAGEQAMQQFAGKVHITIVQPAIVFGGANPAMRAVFRTVARFGIHLAPGLTPHSFSLIHADDLVNMLILAAQRGRRLKADATGDRLPGGISPPGILFSRLRGDSQLRGPGADDGPRRWTPPGACAVHRQAGRVDGGRGRHGHVLRLRPALVFQPGQGPRGHDRLLDLLVANGHRGVGLLSCRPAGPAAASTSRVVSPGRVAVRAEALH